MPDHPDNDDLASVNDLTPEEVNRIIHSHRKVRYGTACWPCRQRKVKCDNKEPCENCIKRDHAQLCSYKPNRGGTSRGSITVAPKKRSRSPSAERSDEQVVERQPSWPRTIANIDDSDAVGDRYVGQNSIPALLRDQSSASNTHDSAGIRQDMRSILGLDNSAPFPLMSGKHLQRLAQDISTELPSDREVMKLFRTYKEIPQQFWGFVVDIDDFEAKLMVYLEDRSRNASNSSRTSRPVTASWLAILFAVLAVGSQYHDSPYHIRTQNSQKYIQISFHFLRLGNFLLRPSFDSIQALLLTSFVLLNDMKAEGSWALTGLTCRLAQSLGLHRPSPFEGKDDIPADIKAKETIRRRLWWTCVWHDTLTSLSFDRSPMTDFPSCAIPVLTPSPTGEYTYLEMMYHLMEIISRRLNPDAIASANYQQIIEHCEAVEVLRTKALPHIRDKTQCKTALHRLQYFAFRLHTCFVISVACRPSLRGDCAMDPRQKKALASRCMINLTETVRMFLAMHQLSVIPTRSWAFTYHGLSSALLLGLLSDKNTDPEIRHLQGDLIAALSATAAKDVSSPPPHVVRTDKDIELSGPLYRALTALRNIYDHGSVTGSEAKREGDSSAGGSGSRTPLPGLGMMNQLPVPPNLQFRAMQSSGNSREDAALAMAEMQNGASLPDLSAVSFPQQLQQGAMGLDTTGGINIDPAQAPFMAPMELFDSIWGEAPEPWNTGVDALNFDFLAQPPPGQPNQQFYF